MEYSVPKTFLLITAHYYRALHSTSTSSACIKEIMRSGKGRNKEKHFNFLPNHFTSRPGNSHLSQTMCIITLPQMDTKKQVFLFFQGYFGKTQPSTEMQLRLYFPCCCCFCLEPFSYLLLTGNTVCCSMGNTILPLNICDESKMS